MITIKLSIKFLLLRNKYYSSKTNNFKIDFLILHGLLLKLFYTKKEVMASNGYQMLSKTISNQK